MGMSTHDWVGPASADLAPVECKSLAVTGWCEAWQKIPGAGRKKMAEKEPNQATCPGCSAQHVRVTSRKNNFRPRANTGNLQADLTPISVTVTYQCQDCAHEWSETVPPMRE